MLSFLSLSQIVFMQPILLSGLVALPALWYLLRITPPAPRRIFFPATRFLKGLVSDEQTPSHTPWWLLLLRLIMAALIIIALARPVINPAQTLYGDEAVRVVLDNSWAAAQNWETQSSTAEEIITQASREKRELYIVTTTPNLGETRIVQYGPMAQGEALSTLRGMLPNPWPADYKALKTAIKEQASTKRIYSIWLSHGLDEGGLNTALLTLQNQGSLKFVMPEPENLPLLLRPSAQLLAQKDLEHNSDIRIDVNAPASIADGLPVSIQALAGDTDVLDVVSTSLSQKDLPQTVSFELLEDFKSEISRFRIAGRKGAGATFLLDDDFKKHSVGIVAPKQAESGAPLINESYYIKRAIEPFSLPRFGDVTALIEENVSVIIMPDTGAMPLQTLNALEEWVKAGGLLLRFSGAHLANAQNDPFLLPVILRDGGRSMSGSLSWEEPQHIAAFEEDSPFYGLDTPLDITVSQQVLADPAQDLTGKIWARLSDGTPFITARKEDKGLLVLIHTTANTEWSNFALSGLYVSVLNRVIRMAGKDTAPLSQLSHGFTSLDPLRILDGFGNLVSPGSAIQPLSATEAETFKSSSLTPPGFYGNAQTQYAFNIGSSLGLKKLKTPSSLPSGVMEGHYARDYEVSMMAPLLYLAALLFALDWLLMIFMMGSGKTLLRKILPIFLLTMCITPPSIAQENAETRYADGLYLAYIKTGDPALDMLSRKGLETLSSVLFKRTSIEPAGVSALDPERDTLAFFPIIFWPISASQSIPSDKAMENIQSYLDHGGTIVFDTRDQNRLSNPENTYALRRITASLDIPPVIPIPSDHVLGRSFYLLKTYPGRSESGTLWVEKVSAKGRDNVSSVLIGSHDWLGSWADSAGDIATNRHVLPHDTSLRRQQEMSLRFGVNLIMYALTGNYKADQVHIKHILRRLGE